MHQNIYVNALENPFNTKIPAIINRIPIISTNVGGLPALLQNNENAILVEKDDVEGMLNAIKEIIMNESKSRMLSMNAREYAEFFDWQNIKNTWSSILKK